jgi:hypothetical protein
MDTIVPQWERWARTKNPIGVTTSNRESLVPGESPTEPILPPIFRGCGNRTRSHMNNPPQGGFQRFQSFPPRQIFLRGPLQQAIGTLARYRANPRCTGRPSARHAVARRGAKRRGILASQFTYAAVARKMLSLERERCIRSAAWRGPGRMKFRTSIGDGTHRG